MHRQLTDTATLQHHSASILTKRASYCTACSRIRRYKAYSKDAANGVVANDAQAIVSQVLDKVAGTDGGINMQQEQRREVDELLNQLEQIGNTQQPRPLNNSLLFGNYNVAYTSSGDDQQGQPAGGRFRGSIGRTLFRTTGVYQSVLQPDIATNKVTFKLFGLLPGAVGLRGKVLPVEAGQPHGRGVSGQGDTVKVLFEPPVLSLGNALHLRIGPPSSVQLSTTYLDDRVRLGKGSRGSLFVFTRGGAADQAGMDKVGIESSTKSGIAWLVGAFAAMVAGGCALWSMGSPGLKLVAGCMWVLTALFTAILRQGGIVRGEDDIARVQEMMQQIQKEREAKAAAEKARRAATAGVQVEQQQPETAAPSGSSATAYASS